MTFLFDKSDQNQQASLKLSDDGGKYSAPAIHCAYYSCIQLMIHVLLTVGGKTETQIDADIETRSSHSYYIKETANLLRKTNSKDVLKFSDEIKDLRDYRVLSDYRNIPITPDDCSRAVRISEKVRNILISTFKL